MTVNLTSYLAVSASLFMIGLLGLILNRRSVILVLMCVELMLLAVNLQLMAFSVYLDDMRGQIFALYVLTVAAAESAIGLALLVIYYRVRGTVAMESINLMHG
jgi:NADH-quinone oxidoreductase subunit K